MQRLIAGTAGHIDHGKSALVKALTGIDPDRLKEEKARGITTDIGFASLPLDLPDGKPGLVSFIDVPGHERFVKNMLAGAHGIDLALLVVAADEGVKPQTVEHLDILRLLGITQLMIVVSKLDLADQVRADRVADRVREIAAGTPFEDAPHLAVSARSGAGLAELKAFLAGQLARRQAPEADELFRLPIDRVFSIAGAGTVVTGTATRAGVKLQDELQIYPAGLPAVGGGKVRVRAIESHGESAEISAPRARTALNLAPLAGTRLEGLARGAILAPLGSLQDAAIHTVHLTLLASAPPLKDLTPVNLHHLSAEFTGRVRLLEGRKTLAPGQSGWAQLWLDQARPLASGDRLVLRRISPPLTWGGALALAPAGKLTRDKTLEEMRPDRAGRLPLDGAILHALRVAGFSTTAELAAALGKTAAQLELVLSKLVGDGRALRLEDKAVLPATLEAMEKKLHLTLDKLHDKFPNATGFKPEQMGVELQRAEFIAHVARGGVIELRGGLCALPGRGPASDPEAARKMAVMLETFIRAGFEGPDPGKLFPTPEGKRLYEELLKSGDVVRIRFDLALSRVAVGRLKDFLLRHKNTGKPLAVGDLKTGLNVSRKWAVPLLEFCDMNHWTLRAGDSRKILL